jgi:argininosuccinate synthase
MIASGSGHISDNAHAVTKGAATNARGIRIMNATAKGRTVVTKQVITSMHSSPIANWTKPPSGKGNDPTLFQNLSKPSISVGVCNDAFLAL